MLDAPIDHARVKSARANLMAFAERLNLENLADDYRRGRDPSDNLKQLLKLQELKKRMGIESTWPHAK